MVLVTGLHQAHMVLCMLACMLNNVCQGVRVWKAFALHSHAYCELTSILLVSIAVMITIYVLITQKPYCTFYL